MKKLLFVGGIMISAAAFAEAPSSSGSETTSNPNQTICRSMPNTGSRVSRTRVCMTRAQWDERRRETRDTLEHAQSSRRSTGD
ncbi:MAG: hypothetical protein QOG13_1910 [Sphingomonadales bacterium]|jgi:hypothetical protein|nr:hypothetical protein [Sphingomonadales bacterium]MEA3043663.1 hypothetical protein [Sphingomonadales bacterium]